MPLVRNAAGAIIDPQQRGITTGLENLVFNLSQPDPICWIFRLSVRAFARLYRATGNDHWLDAAERVHGWLEREHDSLHTTVTNGTR